MFAFEASVIVIGIIGGIANLQMLLILAQSQARKNEMAIVFNQMTLDFLACLTLVISYVVKVLNINYSILFGSTICKVLTGEGLIWYFVGSSTANLVILTLERYVKIVYAVFHKRYFRPWMYLVAIGLTWANLDLMFNAVIGVLSTYVSNGQCLVYAKFPAALNATAYAVYRFLMAFVVPLVVFLFCYSRILQVTHKRILPVNFNNMLKSAAQKKAMKTQMNVIKTFLIISVCFALCWFPNRLFFFLINLRILSNMSSEIRYFTVFMAFLYLCLNPFIYAAKLDPVKKYLRQKLCTNRRQESSENVTSVTNVSGDSMVMQITARSCV